MSPAEEFKSGAAVEQECGTRGGAGLSVNIVAGRSAVTEAWSSNPLKLLVPRSRGPSVWAYLSSFGGGLVAGDQTSVDVSVGEGARCFLTTQSSTKVYRNPDGRPCGHRLTARLEKDSLFILAPDPVQPFADSRYHQAQQFHLAPGAGLVLLDWFTAGRTARGERWSFNQFRSRNDCFIDGGRRLADSLELDRAHGDPGGAHRLGRFNCAALITILGDPLEADAKKLLDEIASRPVERRGRLVIAASPLRGGAVVRVAGERLEEVSQMVYQTLGFAGRLLHDDPWTRKLSSIGHLN